MYQRCFFVTQLSVADDNSRGADFPVIKENEQELYVDKCIEDEDWKKCNVVPHGCGDGELKNFGYIHENNHGWRFSVSAPTSYVREMEEVTRLPTTLRVPYFITGAYNYDNSENYLHEELTGRFMIKKAKKVSPDIKLFAVDLLNSDVILSDKVESDFRARFGDVFFDYIEHASYNIPGLAMRSGNKVKYPGSLRAVYYDWDGSEFTNKRFHMEVCELSTDGGRGEVWQESAPSQ